MAVKKSTTVKSIQDPDCWDRRVRFMYAVNAFSITAISYVLWYNLESRVAETVVTFGFLTLISTMGSFVFGATWQSVTQLKR